MILSIVTTLYKSEPFLERFVERVSKAVQELGIEDYERWENLCDGNWCPYGR